MSVNLSAEERFIYPMLGLVVFFVVIRGVLAIWLPQPYASAIAAFVWIPMGRLLPPGAKRISAAKTMLLAAVGAIFAFAAETLIAML